MTGCVNYSRRFYDETLNDPATASPLVFPETVFNAPASHLAAMLGTTAINYTLVGDPGTFLQGLALAADWLQEARVDGCLVIGAEEVDWLTADAYRLFATKVILSEGAGAVYVRLWDRPSLSLSREESRRSESPGRFPSWEGSKVGSVPSVSTGENSTHSIVRLHSVTGSHLFVRQQNRAHAASRMRSELPIGKPDHLLCDGTLGLRSPDAAELKAWRDWPGSRLAPKRFLGEGLAAASSWQCVAALDALRQGQHPASSVSVVGCNEQAIGAHFLVTDRQSQLSTSRESETSGNTGAAKS